MSSKVSYRQQFTRCGKQHCRKCREGAGHGPYWYAYWSEKGRTVSKYVGTRLPDEVALARQENLNGNVAADMGNTTPLSLPTPVLRMYMLGQFRVDRKSEDTWNTIDSRTWRRRRARTLLGCLLSSPSRKLGREQLMNLLWPDLDVDIAANRLNGAVHELRQILEPEIARPATSRLLRLEHDILALADHTQIWVDAEAFEDLLKDARASSHPDEIEHLLEEAASLYQGGYLLEELYSEWAGQRRDALHRNWVGLLLELATMQIERGSFFYAIETLNRLRNAEPTNETALQRLMLLFTQLDRRGEALQMYRQYVEMLERDYEDHPLPETRLLYEDLRKGKHSPFPADKTEKADRPKASKTHSQGTPAPTSAPTSSNQKTAFLRPTLHAGRPNQSPLIGRQRELETMQKVLLTLEKTTPKKTPSNPSLPQLVLPRSDRVHLLLLTGEPGIGKTRLAEEFSLTAYTREWAVAWSRSFEQEGTIPYRPWTKLLRVLLQGTTSILDDLLNTPSQHVSAPHLPIKLDHLLPLLPDLPLQAATPLHPSTLLPYEQERQYLWEATLGLLDILSSTHPLLLVFDDLHWADDSSIELLAYLARHLQDRRVLLLATCRDAELPPQSKLHALITDLHREQAITTIAVQSLTQAQIETLVSHLHVDIIQSIQAQAAGNPFFAEELARSVNMLYLEKRLPDPASVQPIKHSRQAGLTLTQTAQTSYDADSIILPTNSQLPEAIIAVLERRLGRLSSDCQALLGKAAVLGGSFELRQIVPMSNEHTEETIITLLDEALRAGLLTEEEVGNQISYHFWHPLIISHLYKRLSAARRAYFHRKAAEALQSIPDENIAANIVNHLQKGGGNPGDLARYGELAGNQAYVIAAYAEAQHYYLQTIQAIAGGALQIPVGDSIQMQHITPQSIARLPIPMRLHICQLLDRIAECHVVPGNYEDARYLYECILAVRTKSDIQLYLASSHANDSFQLQRETETQALLWREIGNTWSETGEYDRAYACYRHGREVLQLAGITTGIAWASLHSRYSLQLRFDGQYQEARHYLQEALAVLETCIEPPTFDPQPNETLRMEQETDNPSAAWPQQLQQKALHTRIERTLWGNPFELGYAHEQLGVNLVHSGPLSEALKHLHIALSIYEQCGLLSEMVHASGNLGAVYIMKGEHASAHEFLDRSLELAERIGDLPNMTFVTSNLGDVAQRSGDLLAAEGWFKRSLDLAERINDREGISWGSVELASVQRDLGKLEDARRSLLRAITVGRAIKSPRCVLYALVRVGELRITEALHACPFSHVDSQDHSSHTAPCKRLLLRARSTLQHALSQEGLEIEPFIDGQQQLATAYHLLGESDFALQLAQQTLQAAQENETGRITGCTHRLLGRILTQQGHYEQAATSFELALTLFRTGDLRLDYARTLYSIGISHLQGNRGSAYHSSRNDSQRGLASLREALRIFSDCHAVFDLAWTEQALAQYAD